MSEQYNNSLNQDVVKHIFSFYKGELNQTTFAMDYVVKSLEVYALVKKLCALVITYEFTPPGMMFEALSDNEIYDLDAMLKNTNNLPNEVKPEEAEKYNKDMFNASLLVQIFLAGEAETALIKNPAELLFYKQVLGNLVVAEKLHRNKIGKANRKNYSMLCYDLPIFKAN